MKNSTITVTGAERFLQGKKVRMLCSFTEAGKEYLRMVTTTEEEVTRAKDKNTTVRVCLNGHFEDEFVNLSSIQYIVNDDKRNWPRKLDKVEKNKRKKIS